MAAAKFRKAQRLADNRNKCRDPMTVWPDPLNDHSRLNRHRVNLLALPQTTPLAPLLNCFSGSLSQQRFACNTVLIVLFALLHIADGFITYLGLSFTQVDEVNPLLNYAAGILGLGRAIVLLKLIILGCIAAIFFDRCTIKGRWATVALMLAVVFYGGVVTNNVLLVVGWPA